MLPLLFLGAVAFLVCGWRFYGRFLEKHCQVDPDRPAPAVTQADGVDYVATPTPIVFGHHFSSIAGAGPIVGPIIAALYFGWAPVLLWIILGAVLVGGVHDFGSILMSVRNGGKTLTEITHKLVGPHISRAFRLFLLFALVYVIVVFLDLTASTFSANGPVTTASGWFIICAALLGWLIRRTTIGSTRAILLIAPLSFLGLAFGNTVPELSLNKGTWTMAILAYCFIASTLPVHWLLQPRDFLSSIFLYAMMILGIAGLLLSGETIQAPAFTGLVAHNMPGGFIFPLLFITVACGACSGFHSVVGSGTTSKQLNSEAAVRPVGYGAMLLEGALAVFALATVAILTQEQTSGQNAVAIFSTGASRFMEALGIPAELGAQFTALTVSTFLLTTLDTCSRLSRFLLQEMTEWITPKSRIILTVAVLIPPTILATQTFGGQPAWKALWPLFGATNQLMAGLALVTFVAYLRSEHISPTLAAIPAGLMMATPLIALALMAFDNSVSPALRVMSVGMFALGTYVAIKSLLPHRMSATAAT